VPKHKDHQPKKRLGLKNIQIQLTRPKTRQRLIVDILLVGIVLGIIGLIAFENTRHTKLQNSLENLRNTIISENINVSEVGTNCEKGSRGKTRYSFHKCTSGFTYRNSSISIEEANNIIQKTNEAVTSTRDFTRTLNDTLMLIEDNGRGLRDPSIKLKHKSTGKECTWYYDSQLVNSVGNKIKFDLILTCDDDSWFNKTFRN